MQKSKPIEATDPFIALYPSIAKWIQGGAYVEIGTSEWTGSFVRALDCGGMIFEGLPEYESLHQALLDLDRGIREWIEENGWGR